MLSSLTIYDLCIGLEGWAIQSREWDDVCIGQEEEMAFEFSYSDSQPIEQSFNEKKIVEHIHNERYRINGQVVYCDKDIIIIDIGIFIFQKVYEPVYEFQQGDWLTGCVYINADPLPMYHKFESKPDSPNIYYICKINKILINRTPFKEERFSDLLPYRWVTRDLKNEKFEETNKTQGLKDAVFVEYLLYCSILRHGDEEPSLKALGVRPYI